MENQALDSLMFATVGVTAMFIVTNLVWLVATHRLINKLMSRNYLEYQEAESTLSKVEAKKRSVKDQDKSTFSDEDMGSVSELLQ